MEQFFFKRSIKDHALVKDFLMPLIKKSPQLLINESQGYFSTDYVVSLELVREWYKIAYPIVAEHNQAFKDHFNFTGIDITSIWFQDYPPNGYHVPHVHPSCHFTNVWYLNFPNKGATTKIVDPITKEDILIDVTEGDILTFPSFILHEAAPIAEEKTVISFNTNIV